MAPITIKGGPYALGVQNATQLIQLSTAAAMTSASKTASPVALGSLIVNDTTDYAMTGAVTSGVPKYLVVGIYTKDRRTLKPGQYLSATEAHDGNHWLKVVPVGGVLFEGEEDADSDTITDAEGNTGFCALQITDPTAPDLSQSASQDTYTTVALDSSTAASSDGGSVCVELKGTIDPRPAATGRKRRFLFQFIAAHAGASQS